MMDDVEMTYAEREIDRVEVFERRGKKRQVEREKQQHDDCADPRVRRPKRGRTPFSRPLFEVHIGRKRSPSFRLPVR